MSDVRELSFEESNKLRIELGLAPLTDDKKNDSEKKDQFVHKPAEDLTNKNKNIRILDKLNRRKRERELNDILEEGRNVKFEDESNESFLQCIKKKCEENLLKNKEEKKPIEKQQSHYDSEDLRDLIVQHKPTQFEANRVTILTLKDKGVLDDGDEVLVSTELEEQAKAKKRVANKTRGFYDERYNDSDDDEDILSGAKPRSILSKYDEDLDGELNDSKKPAFKLDNSGKYSMTKEKLWIEQRKEMEKNRINLNSGEYDKPKLASDYIDVDEIFKKMKKPNKNMKIRKKLQQNTVNGSCNSKNKSIKKKIDQEEEGEVLDVKKEKLDEELNGKYDDEEEEEDFYCCDIGAVNITGGVVNKEIWADLKQIDDQQQYVDKWKLKSEPIEDVKPIVKIEDEEKSKESIQLFSNTQSFNDELKDILKKKQNLRIRQQDEDEEEFLEVNRRKREEEEIREREEHEQLQSKMVESCVDDESSEEETYNRMRRGGWQPEENLMDVDYEGKDRNNRKKFHKQKNQVEKKKPLKLTDGILGDEVIVGKGIYSALLYCQKRGFLDEDNKDGDSLLSNKKKQQFDELKCKNYIEEKIRYDDDQRGRRGGNNHHGDSSGPIGTFKDKIIVTSVDDIKLEYVDASGKPLSYKEAFRDLSHSFHGKGSGKIKSAKRKAAAIELMEKEKANTGAINSLIGGNVGNIGSFQNMCRQMRKHEEAASTMIHAAALAGGGGGALPLIATASSNSKQPHLHNKRK